MKIEFDHAKDTKNTEKHGVSLTRAADMNWDTVMAWSDDRDNYGEERFGGLGLIGNRLYFVAFTFRGEAVRVISLRKANRREVKRYESA